MNCYAGLALMKSAPSDRPKTNSMKTAQTQISVEFRAKTKLFRQLFLIQIELTELANESSDYQRELRELIERMDRLMGSMIDDLG